MTFSSNGFFHCAPKSLATLVWGVFICTLLTLFKCGSHKELEEPPIGSLTSFTEAGETLPNSEWWIELNDSHLNELIDSALQNNLDLSATWYRFQAANAIAKREGAALWPRIDFSAQSAFNRPQPDFAGGENVQFGLSARYEVDLWGRIKQATRAEGKRAEASFADYQAASLSLTAELGLSWYRLVAARQQLELAEQQIQTNEDILRLIRARFGVGQVRAVDILRQQQLLESSKIQKLLVEADLDLLEHQLALLLGKQPQNIKLPESIEFPELPALPSVGLPLELVRRRPDVQQAYLSLLASDHDYASAVRAKYPRLDVRLSGQQRSNSFQTLFQDWAYTLAGNILAPIIYGGELSAEVDRTIAVRDQLLANYGQSVLIAFREVEDALVRETLQTKQLEMLETQLDLAQKTNKQLRLEFLNGISPYLDILLALDQEQQLRRNVITERLEQIEARIGLYRALAGPIQTERETSDSESLN